VSAFLGIFEWRFSPPSVLSVFAALYYLYVVLVLYGTEVVVVVAAIGAAD
jgi:hypothetical protein